MALMSTVGMQWVVKNKGKTGISSIQGDLRSTTAMLRRMGTAALAAAGIGGLGYMIKQSMKAIDVVAKMSDELNISTRAIKGLEHAAGIYGTKMENMQKGLQIFVRRLGEAKMGMGEARHGLTAMGVSAEKMAALGTEEAFLTVAEHISKMTDATERAQMAYSMFGRQGVEMINMLMAGRSGIQDMITEADKLGITFSRLDAAKVEQANDALARMRQSMTGLVQNMTISFSPYITALADQMTDMMSSGQNFGDTMVMVMEEVAISVAHLTGEIVGLLRQIDQLRNGSPTTRAREQYKQYTKDQRAWEFSTWNLGATNIKQFEPQYPMIYKEILRQQESKFAYDSDAMAARLRSTFGGIKAGAAQNRTTPPAGTSAGPWAGGYGYGAAAGGDQYERVAAATSAARQEVVKLNEAQQRTLQLSGTIAKNFEDWIMGITTADDALQLIMDSITRMALRMGVTGPMEGAMQQGITAIYNAPTRGGYWNSTSGGSGPGSGPPVGSGGYHGGGMYGEASFSRMGHAGDFAGAPRFHTGIGPGEQRAILNKSEGVFTQGQMRAIGKGMSSPQMNFKVINETGQPVEMEQAGMDFDWDEMVGTAIIRLHRQRGEVYDSTKQISKDAY